MAVYSYQFLTFEKRSQWRARCPRRLWRLSLLTFVVSNGPGEWYHHEVISDPSRKSKNETDRLDLLSGGEKLSPVIHVILNIYKSSIFIITINLINRLSLRPLDNTTHLPCILPPCINPRDIITGD